MARGRDTKFILSAEDRTRAAFDSARRNVAGLEGAFAGLDGVAARLPLIGSSIAAAFGGASITGAIKSVIDFEDRLNDLTKSTGLTVEQLSGLNLLAKQSGSDLDGLAKGVNKLSKEMGKTPEKFRALGVSATDPLEAFAQFATVFNNIEDVQTRNAVAAAALGKSWESLAPVLAEGGDNILKIVERGARMSGITKEMTDRADKFNDKLAELEVRGVSFLARVSSPIVEGLIAISDEFERTESKLNSFLKVWLSTSGALAKFVMPPALAKLFAGAAQLGFNALSDTGARDTGNRRIGGPAGATIKPSKSAIGAFINPDGSGKEKVAPNLLFGSGKLDLHADMEKSMEALAKRVGDPLKDLMAKYEEAAQVIDDTRTPLEKLEATTKRLNELQASGVLQADDYSRAINKAQDEFATAVGKSGDALDEFAKNAAKNVQDSLADFLFDPFKDGLKGMVDGFSITVRRMVAEAAAADLTRALFGKIAGGSGEGALGGLFGGVLKNVFGSLVGGSTQAPAPVQDALVRSLPGRASGGPVMAGKPYIVGEKRPEIFVPSQPGTILPSTQFGGRSVSQVNHFHITGPIDRRSQQQIAMQAGAAAQRALARNG